jgi:hypothetical protein
MRWSTPGIRTCWRWKRKYESTFRASPIPKMIAERRSVWRKRSLFAAPLSRRRPNENAIETPTMKRKKGKIVSVYVQPCHSAWRNGA